MQSKLIVSFVYEDDEPFMEFVFNDTPYYLSEHDAVQLANAILSHFHTDEIVAPMQFLTI